MNYTLDDSGTVDLKLEKPTPKQTEWIEAAVKRIEGMEQITMIPPSRFGDGKPTRIPDSDYCKGFNEGLAAAIKAVRGEE